MFEEMLNQKATDNQRKLAACCKGWATRTQLVLDEYKKVAHEELSPIHGPEDAYLLVAVENKLIEARVLMDELGRQLKSGVEQ